MQCIWIVFIKAVTSIVGGDRAIVEEFLQNLAALTVILDLNKLLILLMESAYLSFDNSISLNFRLIRQALKIVVFHLLAKPIFWLSEHSLSVTFSG